MSISDNEDLDTKPAPRPPTKERKKGGGEVDINDGTGGRHPKIILTPEQIKDVGYRRTASLLMGGHDGVGGASSFSDHDTMMATSSPTREHDHDNDVEITVIPSLVSLSDDFFCPPPSPPVAAAASASANFNNNTVDDSVPFPVLTGSAASSGTRSRREISFAAHPHLPSLRPRLLTSYSSSSFYNNDYDPPPENWPIGPQGAPVPSHLLNADDDDEYEEVGAGRRSSASSAAENLQYNTSLTFQSSSTAASSSSSSLHYYSPQPSFTAAEDSAEATLNPPSSAPTFGEPSPLYTAARRLSSRHRRDSRAQQRRQHQQPQPRPHINAVQSLDHAVRRLEERLNDKKPNNSNSREVDEIECNIVTKLAEIMLHPPTSLIDDRYCWDDDDDGNGNGDEMTDDSKMREEDKLRCEAAGGKESVDNCVEEDRESSNDAMDDSSSQPTSKQQTTTPRYTTISSVKASITASYSTLPRRVCQYPFKRNDIVWVCRTCQSDETCVLCHECFSNSNHEGHDVAFYHAQAGGCCDCGDG